MFKNKTKTMDLLLANNGYSTPFHGDERRKQKNHSNSKNYYVFGQKKSKIIKPRKEGGYPKKSKGQIALKSNIVPRPGLPYKKADFEEALGNPSIFGPPRDCIHCNGTGCVHC